jgi:hypothetical protein
LIYSFLDGKMMALFSSSNFLRQLSLKSSILSLSSSREIHSTRPLLELRKLARVRCVDNSAIGKQAMAEGKPPKIIHVYNKKAIATIGNFI